MVGPLNIGKAKEGIGMTTEGLAKVTENIRKATRVTSTHVADQASNAKKKLEELTVKAPDPYDEAVAEYNSVFTAMNDKGVSLLRQRDRSTDVIELIEMLVNSIANAPKSFETDFDEISLRKKEFLQSEEFAQKDLEAARQSAAGAGVGFTAGAAVASMAPTAAMWVATTFGTASTGTAISTLSGAAATNATLAWLGGGALAAGGGGTAAGSALLAMAGPIGWTIAGATLLTSIVLFTKKKFENREAKEDALTAVKQNTAFIRSMDVQIAALLKESTALRESLVTLYGECVIFFNADFPALADSHQSKLATLVNNTKSCAALLSKHVRQSPGDE
ncbi:hypothetical protein [Arthrobacter sp. CJ23]|uniref:hypothetical protein n=1 Tax=Arthrobacter sp. CJ23 TaxID=2972479 RepID=UPI00215D4C58|nr:hypothetical protein [Arthrobacter sp. CJ23]UVJ40560.1 hypothetical protein NVV90_05135 [Arthrobacter sp. CJ23]